MRHGTTAPTSDTPPVVRAGVSRAVRRAAEALRAGGVILYPTETVYGLGADACNPAACAAVRRIKGRDPAHPFLALVASGEEAARWVVFNASARALADAFWPGPLTLILPRAEGVPPSCFEGMAHVALRVSDNPFCRALTQRFSRPIVSTSANKTGEPVRGCVEEILASLGSGARHIALAVDAGPLPPRSASTLVDCTGVAPRVVREGVITEAQIHAALRE